MSRSETPVGPVATVARRVKEIRGRRGLNAKELGERLTAQGVPWDRFTVANLESGKRQNVTVTELLALGTALNVAPVHLLVPIDGDDDEYQVTPAKTASVKDVRAWVRGNVSLGNGPHKQFTAEAPEGEWVSFDVTTREGARAAAEWAKRSGMGTVAERGSGDE